MQFDSAAMQMLIKGVGEIPCMMFPSSAPSYVIGIPLGIALVVTDRDGISLVPLFNKALGLVINVLRPIPFIILLTIVIPITKVIVGRIISRNTIVVPLVITTTPYIGRMAESSLKEVDAGVIEAAKSMEASIWQIIMKVLLPEAKPSLLVGAAIPITTILGYSAMTGFTGGSSLNDVAIRYGYHRYQTDMMMVTAAFLIIIVRLIQEVFMRMSRRSDERVR